MKALLNRLIQYENITEQEAYDTLVKISKGEVNEAHATVFMTVFMMRSITVEELKGFRRALLDLCVQVDLNQDKYIDMCGTGGDGKNTFNISTLSSFVVAGAGAKVSKHGNYGVSSACGSSNVMEALGYKFSNDQGILSKQLEKAGICILHAPLFHPAMASVGPIRKALGMKTFFNMLGPLVNPSHPTHQSVGVFNLEVGRLYHYLLSDLNKKYRVVHALDGYDEISLTGEFKLIGNQEEAQFSPKDFGLKTVEANAIFGGDTVQEAKDIFLKIIDQEGTESQNEVVYANAGVALQTYFECSMQEAIEMAKESLQSGAAKNALINAIKYSNN